MKPDGTLSVDTQTAYALALYMDLVPAEKRNAVWRSARRTRSGKVPPPRTRASPRAFSARVLCCRCLSSAGQHDLAVQLFQSHKFPSWGYEVDQGATTIWERWNSYTKDKGFGGEQNASMNSFAHYSFGAVCEWMFFALAGIDTEGPGYQRIVIRPTPPSPGSNPDGKPIDWVKAHYDSPHGRIVSNWKMGDGQFELETVIPANTAATVYLPAASVESIREGGKTLDQVKEVKLVRMENGRAALSVGAGNYRFVSKP